MRKELRRDAGLARLARTTRWLTAGAVVSAGGLSLAVANSFPGHSSKAVPSRTATTQEPTTEPAPTTQPSDDQPAGSPATAAPTTTLSPPTAPPQTATTVPVVSSGGS